jgi:hypothetical protein
MADDLKTWTGTPHQIRKPMCVIRLPRKWFCFWRRSWRYRLVCGGCFNHWTQRMPIHTPRHGGIAVCPECLTWAEWGPPEWAGRREMYIK